MRKTSHWRTQRQQARTNRHEAKRRAKRQGKRTPKRMTQEAKLQTYKRVRRNAQLAMLQWMFGTRETPYAQPISTRLRQKKVA